MNKENHEQVKKNLAILALVIVVTLIGHVVSVVSFNQTVHTVRGADESSASYLSLGNREDSTSTWLKRNFDLYGETVDLSAQTFDGTFYNNSQDDVTSWKLTIHIKGDCFINNAWCGVMEIHQYVGTPREQVQTLDLRNYKLDEVKLDYLNDGDLLIALKKGDYLVYYPSEKDQELFIKSQSELTMGMIFYYLGSVDLTDYQLEYYYHRDFTEGIGFYVVVALLVVWLAVYFAMRIAEISYKRAWKEMELRKSGIAYMSDLYDSIFIIDMVNDELIPVATHAQTDGQLTKQSGARKELQNLFLEDVDDSYTDLMQKFVDLATIQQRLRKDSIACEYISKSSGWCQARFFAMDRVENQPMQKILFTIQNINDEKLEMDRIEERITRSVSERTVKKSIYNNISREIRTPIGTMLNLTEQISAASSEKPVQEYAHKLRREGEAFQLLLNKILDASRISAGLTELHPEEYSFKQLLIDIYHVTAPGAAAKNLELKVDVTPSIPDRLYGDWQKLRQMILYLLNNAMRYTNSGSIKLSVFGKCTENQVHLLISVKDTGEGFSEAECRRMTEHWSCAKQNIGREMEESELGLNLVNDLLSLMDSRLQLISEPGEGSEFYFELEQTVRGSESVGSVDFSGEQ